MQSIKHFSLARLLLLLLLTQHAVVAVAMSDGGMSMANAAMTDMLDGAAHDCGDTGMAGMKHANSDQLHQDHQQCIDSGCTDCVGSVAAALSSNPPIAVSLHATLNVQWFAHLLVTAQPDILYRPPIQN